MRLPSEGDGSSAVKNSSLCLDIRASIFFVRREKHVGFRGIFSVFGMTYLRFLLYFTPIISVVITVFVIIISPPLPFHIIEDDAQHFDF